MFDVHSIVVCVEFDDLLKITLAKNKRHFTRTLVVTSSTDTKTQNLVRSLDCECYATDAFYHNGAYFNKGAAIEEGFDVLGREGWICVWDADIVMPSHFVLPRLDTECLYGPYRFILDDPKEYSEDLIWSMCRMPSKPNEYPGYFQLFNAAASVLQKRPWYSTDWKHAGGCDSDFQFRFDIKNLCRLPFHVLHLGTDYQNWCGRTTERLDNETIPQQQQRQQQLQQLLSQRSVSGFAAEKL